jgi:uncharacterized caspase-like protein
MKTPRPCLLVVVLLLAATTPARAADGALKDKASNCKQIVWEGGVHPTKVCAKPYGAKKCAKTCKPWLDLATAGEMRAHPRMALVIGNGGYKELSKLENAKNDAEAMSVKLKLLQFDVTEVYDADADAMQSVIDAFTEKLVPDVVAFFYYAGHGAAPGGKDNYLLPVDIDKAKIQKNPKMLKRAAFDVSNIVKDMEERQTKVNIVVLDACRDDPFGGGSRAVGAGGMASISPPEGSVIVFAAKSGQTAGDGVGVEGHGLFTDSLLQHMESHAHLPLLKLMGMVRSDVFKLSGQKQRPEIIADLIDDAENMLLDGNIAKRTAISAPAGGAGGYDSEKVAKLETQLAKADAKEAQKRKAVEAREKEDVKREKEAAEADAALDGKASRKKQAAERKDKLVAETKKAEEEEQRLEREEQALRRQQDSRTHVQTQEELVAQLKEEIKELVQEEQYVDAGAKKKVLEAAQQVLEKMGACSASGTCTATDRKGPGWAATFGFGSSGGTVDGEKTEPSPETGGEEAGAPQETGNEGEDQAEEASTQEGGGVWAAITPWLTAGTPIPGTTFRLYTAFGTVVAGVGCCLVAKTELVKINGNNTPCVLIGLMSIGLCICHILGWGLLWTLSALSVKPEDAEASIVLLICGALPYIFFRIFF